MHCVVAEIKVGPLQQLFDLGKVKDGAHEFGIHFGRVDHLDGERVVYLG
jgi:hypothetical protein